MGRGRNGSDQPDLNAGRRGHNDVTQAPVKVEVFEQQAMLVTPGVIDAAAHAAFSSGQCHALAVALHDQTGWPLRAIEDDDTDIVHVYVETPDGAALDIAGVHRNRDEYVSAWGSYDEPIDREQLLDLVDSGGWREPNLEAAASFVPTVLEYAQGARENLAGPGIDDVPRVQTVPLEKYVVPGLNGARHVLRPGVLDSNALRAFAFGGGQAHALTWGLVGARDNLKAAVVWHDGEPVHTVALTEDGKIVDINGVRDLATFKWQQFGDKEADVEVETVKWKHLDDVVTEYDWPSFDLATARSFAPVVLKQLGL